MKAFSPKTIKALKHYVYLLVDPRDNACFYVGKGQGNRCFDHIKHPKGEDEKASTIREIHEAGLAVQIYIPRYGLETKEIAFQVEATLIDVFNNLKDTALSIGENSLANKQSGHHSSICGFMSAEGLNRRYSAEAVEIRHRAIAVKIDCAISEKKDIYEATRKAWRLSLRRANNTPYLMAIHLGIIEEVYVGVWKPSAEGVRRLEFEGVVAEDEVRNYYKGKRLPDTEKKKGSQNPVRYLQPEG